MAKKRNAQTKKVRTIRILGYQNANKIRNYMKLMDMYGREEVINPDNPIDGAIFYTVPLTLEDWLRLSKYVFTTLNGDEPVTF